MVPAANNLQEGNLADKKGLTGKKLPTCIHCTGSNPATGIPHLPGKGIVTISVQIRLLLPQKTRPKEKQNKHSPAFYQTFHPDMALEKFGNSVKSAPG